MKKITINIEIKDEHSKRRMLKTIAGIQGVDSVAVDGKENKVTVIGDTDPVNLMSKLRKFGHVELLSVGPAREVKVGSASEMKVGSAKEEKNEGEKSHSKAKNTGQAVEVVYAPPSDQYRPVEYTVHSDKEPNVCSIS